jgi:hypothetical protein
VGRPAERRSPAPTRADAKALLLGALRECLSSLRSEATGGDGEREPIALTIAA